MLPIMAAVRKAEGIHESSRVSLQLTIVAEST